MHDVIVITAVNVIFRGHISPYHANFIDSCVETCGPMDQAGFLRIHRDGRAGCPPVANKEVGGLATAFNLTEIRRAQSGGAFDDKSKILASAWSSSDVASASRHVKLETAVVC